MRNFIKLIIGLILTSNLTAQTSPFINVIGWDSLGGFAMEGPDAPDVQLSLQGNAIKIDISNSAISNNYNESYWMNDTSIHNGFNGFLFQGYIVYQVIDSTTLLFPTYFDTSKTRVVAQSDIMDAVDTLKNHYLNTLTNNCDSALMVQGNNLGIQHSYSITSDAFSGGGFQQGNTYCYSVLSYAHNGNKIGGDCNLPWPFLVSRRMHGEEGVKIFCVTYNPNSIDDYFNELKLNFYPNPTNANITINFENQVQGLSIQLTSIDGQILIEREYSNTSSVHLNLEKFSPSIYFAKITTNKGSRTIKLIKQ